MLINVQTEQHEGNDPAGHSKLTDAPFHELYISRSSGASSSTQTELIQKFYYQNQALLNSILIKL